MSLFILFSLQHHPVLPTKGTVAHLRTQTGPDQLFADSEFSALFASGLMHVLQPPFCRYWLYYYPDQDPHRQWQRKPVTVRNLQPQDTAMPTNCIFSFDRNFACMKVLSNATLIPHVAAFEREVCRPLYLHRARIKAANLVIILECSWWPQTECVYSINDNRRIWYPLMLLGHPLWTVGLHTSELNSIFAIVLA